MHPPSRLLRPGRPVPYSALLEKAPCAVCPSRRPPWRGTVTGGPRGRLVEFACQGAGEPPPGVCGERPQWKECRKPQVIPAVPLFQAFCSPRWHSRDTDILPQPPHFGQNSENLEKGGQGAALRAQGSSLDLSILSPAVTSR